MSGADQSAVRRRGSNRLTSTFVTKSRKKPGRYVDGDGLCLVVDATGAQRWVLRIQANGKRRDVGLGGASVVTLAEARDLAHDIRRKARAGADPVAARRAARTSVPTFETLAKTVHAAQAKSWRNGKHQEQWIATLERLAFPTIGKLPVNRIETGDVLKVLLPIWTETPETARRVMQRIRTVLDHATAAGHRSGENPCRIAAIGLPRQSASVQHFAALPYSELPAFLPQLQTAKAADEIKLAVEFLILTAARSGEVRNAVKSEIDIKTRLWTVPAERMKAARDHVVPLSPRAIEIVDRALVLAPRGDLLFPSARTWGKPLSDMALTMALRRIRPGITAHGFRSTFRDWASETTDTPSEVVEMALAHAISNRVEAAYRRGNLLDKRRRLMEAWAAYAGGETAEHNGAR